MAKKEADEPTDQTMLAEGAGDQGTAADNTLAPLAAALVNLSAADRAKLAAMLFAGNACASDDGPGNHRSDGGAG